MVVDELVVSLRAQLEMTSATLVTAQSEAEELKRLAKQGLEEQGKAHANQVQELQDQVMVNKQIKLVLRVLVSFFERKLSFHQFDWVGRAGRSFPPSLSSIF